jgi:hypothetical protein
MKCIRLPCRYGDVATCGRAALCPVLLCPTSVPTSCAVDVVWGHFLWSLRPGTVLNTGQLGPETVLVFVFFGINCFNFGSIRAVLSGTVHGNDLIR